MVGVSIRLFLSKILAWVFFFAAFLCIEMALNFQKSQLNFP